MECCAIIKVKKGMVECFQRHILDLPKIYDEAFLRKYEAVNHIHATFSFYTP